jgi:hypothetical protein
MRKLWKGVLLGGAVGAGVRLVQDVRSDDAHDELGLRVGKAAAEAAMVGGAIGWYLDRRDRRRMIALASGPSLSSILAQAAERAEAVGHAAELAVRRAQQTAEHATPVLQDAAGAAVERLQQAAELAVPAVAAAAGSARGHLNAAADLARPHVASASEAAKLRALAAAEAARPHVASASEAAKLRALAAAEAARPHVASASEAAKLRALAAAEAARPHVASASEAAKLRALAAGEAARPHVLSAGRRPEHVRSSPATQHDPTCRRPPSWLPPEPCWRPRTPAPSSTWPAPRSPSWRRPDESGPAPDVAGPALRPRRGVRRHPHRRPPDAGRMGPRPGARLARGPRQHGGPGARTGCRRRRSTPCAG